MPVHTNKLALKIKNRAISQIEQLQDFHVFTGVSYDRYVKMVKAGLIHESITNTRTNTILKEDKLSEILLRYLDRDLPQVIIYQLVSYFDVFYDDLCKILKIQRDKNKDINKEFLLLKRLISIKKISPDDIKRLVELRETRHKIAHNSGVVDQKYIDKTGSFARAKLGENLPLSRSYLYNSADFIKQIIQELVN